MPGQSIKKECIPTKKVKIEKKKREIWGGSYSKKISASKQSPFLIRLSSNLENKEKKINKGNKEANYETI